MQVKRRHVIYVQGYDPRGLPEYYRTFRGEYRRTCELYGLKGDVGRPSEESERFATTWDLKTRGNGWQVETTYEFLRWEHIIRKDFTRPAWWKLINAFGSFLRSLVNGLFFRILRAHWRFGMFLAYPIVLMLIFAFISLLLGAAALTSATMLGMPVPFPQLAALSVIAGAFIFLLRSTEAQTYLLYLCDDGISSRQYALGLRPDWEKRMEVFAGYVVEAARAAAADEIVVVGHSSGSFLAVDVMARALARDPELGKHGPRVMLLTIGANLPIIGFNPEAQWFRDQIARLAVESSIGWVDYQSRHDIMNFSPFDPVEGHRIKLTQPRHNPTVNHVSFRDLWVGSDFTRRRWRFFRAHFQFVMANERLWIPYDYYMICCGPADLATRAAKPEEAVAASKGKDP